MPTPDVKRLREKLKKEQFIFNQDDLRSIPSYDNRNSHTQAELGSENHSSTTRTQASRQKHKLLIFPFNLIQISFILLKTLILFIFTGLGYVLGRYDSIPKRIALILLLFSITIYYKANLLPNSDSDYAALSAPLKQVEIRKEQSRKQSSTKINKNAANIRELKTRLKALGFFYGTINGYDNRGFRLAISRYFNAKKRNTPSSFPVIYLDIKRKHRQMVANIQYCLYLLGFYKDKKPDGLIGLKTANAIALEEGKSIHQLNKMGRFEKIKQYQPTLTKLQELKSKYKQCTNTFSMSL